MKESPIQTNNSKKMANCPQPKQLPIQKFGAKQQSQQQPAEIQIIENTALPIAARSCSAKISI